MASSSVRQYDVTTSANGTRAMSSCSRTFSNDGVSITDIRTHAPIASSTVLARKQARQPQARNASSGSSDASRKAPDARKSPAGTPT